MASTSTAPSHEDAANTDPSGKATSILVIGMAGSGKSTFAGALSKFLAEGEGEGGSSSPKKDAYVVNLDPAVGGLNYEPNVDIRDTIDYKRVMEE